MFGFKVRLHLNARCPFGPTVVWLRNVTEIHWGYRPGIVAFESDIHGTGIFYETDWIVEYEAITEGYIANAF